LPYQLVSFLTYQLKEKEERMTEMNKRKKGFTLLDSKHLTGFTLVELMLVVVIIGILMFAGAIKFKDMRSQMKIDETKAKMKAIQVAIKMYYADVGHFPVLLAGYSSNWSHTGLGETSAGNDTSKWVDYLINGVPNSVGNLEDANSDGKIDNWNGPYVENESIFKDAWEHRFAWRNYMGNDSFYSAIVSQGPMGNDDGNSFRFITRSGASSPAAAVFAKQVKDELYPPDEEGFSIIPQNGDDKNLETDFNIVLWLE